MKNYLSSKENWGYNKIEEMVDMGEMGWIGDKKYDK